MEEKREDEITVKNMAGRLVALAFMLGVLGFGVAACGSDDSDSGDGGSDAASTEMTEEQLKWATDFTGGSGAADESAAPFVIGFANNQGGVPSHPEPTDAMQAAAEFINEELGGIAGRPVEVKNCFMTAEEDGQKCAAEFLGDDRIGVVVVGVAEYGTASLYKAIAGKIPVLVGTPAGEPDTTTPNVYTLNGGAIAPIGADGILATQVPGATKSAVLHSDNPIGTFVATDLLKPTLEAGGLEVSLVPVADTATAPEVASAIQASGAAEAEVFQLTTLGPTCIAAANALEQQNLTPTVITTVSCWQPEVYEAGDGKLPDGWIYTSFGDSPRVPNAENGRDTYVAAMEAAGMPESSTMNGDASLAFSTVMAIASMGNKLGDQLDRPSLLEAIKNYRGPLMMAPGKPACGKVSSIFPGVCTTLSPRQQSVDGVLEALPPVNVKSLLNPPS
jgi:branched-chain amino acid transport system substrate-binding protein